MTNKPKPRIKNAIQLLPIGIVSNHTDPLPFQTVLIYVLESVWTCIGPQIRNQVDSHVWHTNEQ